MNQFIDLILGVLMMEINKINNNIPINDSKIHQCIVFISHNTSTNLNIISQHITIIISPNSKIIRIVHNTTIILHNRFRFSFINICLNVKIPPIEIGGQTSIE